MNETNFSLCNSNLESLIYGFHKPRGLFIFYLFSKNYFIPLWVPYAVTFLE